MKARDFKSLASTNFATWANNTRWSSTSIITLFILASVVLRTTGRFRLLPLATLVLPVHRLPQRHLDINIDGLYIRLLRYEYGRSTTTPSRQIVLHLGFIYTSLNLEAGPGVEPR